MATPAQTRVASCLPLPSLCRPVFQAIAGQEPHNRCGSPAPGPTPFGASATHSGYTDAEKPGHLSVKPGFERALPLRDLNTGPSD